MIIDAPQLYSYYGYRLQSELPLTSLAGDLSGILAPEITLTEGVLGPDLPDVVWSSPFVSIASDGAALINVDAIGRFLVTGGNRVTVDCAPGVALPELEAFLMGPIAGVVLHQRGIMPLHASSVEIAGCAIALSGSVGRGKSTIAAALVRSGATFLSDDICPVGFDNSGDPITVPGSAGLKLWPDSYRYFEADAGSWVPVRKGHQKRVGWLVGRQSQSSGRSLRLRAIIRLVDGRAPEIRRVQGPSSVVPLDELIYRLQLGRALGKIELLFQNAMRMANRIPVFEMCRPRNLDRLDQTVNSILTAIQGYV